MTTILAPISLPIAFDGDRMVVTNPASNRRLRRQRLSPSTAKGMEGCPARYAAEKLLPGVEDPFGAAPLGTSGHAVMEALMQQPGPLRTPERAEELLITELLNRAAPRPKESWPGIAATQGAEWLTSVRAAFSGLFSIIDPTTVSVYSTEMHLDTAEVAGVPFVGYIDLVQRVESPFGGDRFKIVDYKSSRKMPWTPRGQINAHEDQLRTYILAFSNVEQIPTSHVSAAVYYTRDKLARAKPVPASRSKLDDTARRFSRAWTDLNTYVDQAAWPCVSSPLCGWCPLVSVCPVAKADGRVARLDGLPTAEQFDVPILRELNTEMYLAEADLRALRSAPEPDDISPDMAHLNALADEFGAKYPRNTPEPVEDPVVDLAPDSAEDSMAGFGAVGECPAVAAHVSDNGRAPAPESKDETMPSTFLREDKVYEETSGPNSTLNPNSFASMAAFGTVELAVKTLHEAGFPIRLAAVTELSQTLAAVVAKVQTGITGRVSMQEGMNSRLRGALHTAMETLPCPLGASSDELHAWTEAITRRTRSVALAAIALWDAGEPEVPEEFVALVGLRRVA